MELGTRWHIVEGLYFLLSLVELMASSAVSRCLGNVVRRISSEEADRCSDGMDILRTAIALALKPQRRSLKVRLLGVRQRLENGLSSLPSAVE